MNGRGIVSFFLGILAIALIVGLGAGVYNAGVAQGLAQSGSVPAGAVVPYVGYGYGYGFPGFFGFGFLGLLFPILFLFLIFGLIRAAFRGGRGGWGHHGWGPYWGRGGWGPGGPTGSEGWREERERTIADLHRRLHEEEAKGSTTAGGAGGRAGSGGPSGQPGTGPAGPGAA